MKAISMFFVVFAVIVFAFNIYHGDIEPAIAGSLFLLGIAGIITLIDKAIQKNRKQP